MTRTAIGPAQVTNTAVWRLIRPAHRTRGLGLEGKDAPQTFFKWCSCGDLYSIYPKIPPPATISPSPVS